MPISVNVLMALVGPTSTEMSRVKDGSETYRPKGGRRVKVGTVDVDSRREGNVITFDIACPVEIDVTAVFPVNIEVPG